MPPVKNDSQSAKKPAPPKPAPHEDPLKDLRRAYEHLGRVGILHSQLAHGAAHDITALTKLAEQQLAAGHNKDAADLLRAAEHLSFAALTAPTAEKGVDPHLVEAITSELNHKLEKAEEHWSKQDKHPAAIEPIYTHVVRSAQVSLGHRAYRQALEYARGAEALAHVKIHPPKQLGAATGQPKLKP